VVEISSLGSERARVGDRPGYSTIDAWIEDKLRPALRDLARRE